MPEKVEYRGARFYKCALQVNPYSYGKFRGENIPDEDVYNQRILEKCRENNIEVVGLADHGSIDNSKNLRRYLTENSIIVFPGFEIASSEKIHMVCLYDESKTDSELNGFLGQLMGDAKSGKDPTRESTLSCYDIARKVKGREGFWYAAHATGRNGILRLSGDGDNFVNLWKEDNLVEVIQIPGPLEAMDVDNKDLKKYKEIIENKNTDYKRNRNIVIINAQDICAPDDLSEPSASCLVKMTTPTFGAFKNAFKDSQSRICLNHKVPSKPISAIESIRWRGAGLFENQELAFSSNLNAIIGGRGTGKSTLIESIRFVLDLPVRSINNAMADKIREKNLRDSQIEIRVRCASQHGEIYIISRRHGEAPVVTNEHGELSHMRPIDLGAGIDNHLISSLTHCFS